MLQYNPSFQYAFVCKALLNILQDAIAAIIWSTVVNPCELAKFSYFYLQEVLKFRPSGQVYQLCIIFNPKQPTYLLGMVCPKFHRVVPIWESSPGPGDNVRVLSDPPEHPETSLQRRRDDGQGCSRAQRFSRLRAVDQHKHSVLPRQVLHVENQVRLIESESWNLRVNPTKLWFKIWKQMCLLNTKLEKSYIIL